MARWEKMFPDTLAFPWAQWTPWAGVPAVLTVGLALAVGQAVGHPAAGSIAAGAAFTVGFAVFHEALASSLLSMAAVTLAAASATLAGSLGASRTWVVVLLAVVAAVNYGLLAGLGPTAGWVGQQAAVFLVIASGFARGRQYAVGRAEMVLLGGAMQMATYAVTYAFRHRDRETAPLGRQLRTRAGQLARTLRDELRWRSETTGYVVRLAVVMGVASVAAREVHLNNSYWAPMTAVLVLKPQWTGTLSRGAARMVGTVLGAGLALVLAHLQPLPGGLVFALVVVTAWGCYALQAVNYAAFSFFLTLYTVFSFRWGGFSQPAAAHLRLLNTAIGGGIAMAVDGMWRISGLERAEKKV